MRTLDATIGGLLVAFVASVIATIWTADPRWILTGVVAFIVAGFLAGAANEARP